EQLVVLGIGAQRRAVECGSRPRIALNASMTGGEIAAGHGQRLQIAPGRKLRRGIVGAIGRLRRTSARKQRRGKSEGDNGHAIATNERHLIRSWFLKNFSDRLECGPKRRRPRYTTMPLLTLNRKDQRR